MTVFLAGAALFASPLGRIGREDGLCSTRLARLCVASATARPAVVAVGLMFIGASSAIVDTR